MLFYGLDFYRRSDYMFSDFSLPEESTKKKLIIKKLEISVELPNFAKNLSLR